MYIQIHTPGTHHFILTDDYLFSLMLGKKCSSFISVPYFPLFSVWFQLSFSSSEKCIVPFLIIFLGFSLFFSFRLVVQKNALNICTFFHNLILVCK